MTELLANIHLWAKALHIMSVIAWMAGLFYLPRLFVYHVEAAKPGDSRDEVFQVMERKLLRAIMIPAMLSTWFFGLILVMTPGVVDWSSLWPWFKAGGVLGLTWFQFWLGQQRKDLANGNCTISGRAFRAMNEVPTLAMIVIVFAVVLKF